MRRQPRIIPEHIRIARGIDSDGHPKEPRPRKAHGEGGDDSAGEARAQGDAQERGREEH